MIDPRGTYLNASFLNYIVSLDDDRLYSFMSGFSRQTIIEITFLFRFGYIDFRSTAWTSFLAYNALAWYLDINPHLLQDYEWLTHARDVERKWHLSVKAANEKGLAENVLKNSHISNRG